MSNNDEYNDEGTGYQIIVTDICYGNRTGSRNNAKRPGIMSLDVPASLLKMRESHDEQRFKDAVESFAYNTITRKCGAEVNHCQVWLPMEADA